MAGERTLPGLDLTGYWTSTSNGWEGQMDANLRALSALAQIVVSSISALPGSPVNGDRVIVSTVGGNQNKIAVRDNGAWVYLTPKAGWVAYVADVGRHFVFNGTTWGPYLSAIDPGAMILLGSADVTSAVAAVDVSLVSHLSAGYTNFELHARTRPATDGADMLMRVSTDGGSSFLTTNYFTQAAVWASFAFAGTSGDSTFQRVCSNCGNVAGEDVILRADIRIDSDAARLMIEGGAFSNASVMAGCLSGGWRGGSVNALRMAFSSGNVATCYWELYGFRDF